MKLVHLTLVALFVCSAAWAQATPDEHAAHHPTEVAAAPASATPQSSASIGELEQRMASMQALMDRAGKARTSAERKRLLKEHSDAMRAQIHALREMDCPMKMGMGMGMGMKGDMMGKGEPDKPAAMPGMGAGGMQGDMMRCHDMMKSRMDMMIQMMDQMLQHQDAASAGK